MFCIATDEHCWLRFETCKCRHCQAFKCYVRALRFFSSAALAELYKLFPSGPTHKHLRLGILNAKTEIDYEASLFGNYKF